MSDGITEAYRGTYQDRSQPTKKKNNKKEKTKIKGEKIKKDIKNQIQKLKLKVKEYEEWSQGCTSAVRRYKATAQYLKTVIQANLVEAQECESQAQKLTSKVQKYKDKIKKLKTKIKGE